MRLAILSHDQKRRCALALAGLAAAAAIGWASMVHAQTDDTMHPTILYIDGQAGDHNYNKYQLKFGWSRGCTNLAVVDDTANPIRGTIFSVESCDLTQLDIDNVGEILGDVLLYQGPRYDIHLPTVIH